MVEENIVTKPAKQFNGVCEVPDSHWVRVGTMTQALSY